MSVRIVSEKPWWWWLLKMRFPIEWGTTAVTFGNTIYFGGHAFTPDHYLHELVHVRQQAEGKWSYLWHYLVDSQFRYAMELEAMREQYRSLVRAGMDRNQLSYMQNLMAEELASATYGNIVNYAQALTALRVV